MRNVNLLEQLNMAQAQTEALVGHNTALETKAEALIKLNTALETKTEQLVTHNTALETALAALRASRSWRITAPVRITSRLLGHVKWRR